MNQVSGPESAPSDNQRIYQPELPRHGAALAAMLLAAFLFAVMGVATRGAHEATAGRPIPSSEVALIRFLFGALVVLPMHGRRGIDLRGRDRVGLAWRGVWGGFAVLTYFASLHYTSLANAQILNYTSLIFAPLFAILWLNEKITRRAAVAILAASLGIVAILGKDLGGPRLGDLFGLISGVMAGGAITSIRRLRRSESSWAVFFYLCLVGIPVSLIGCLFQKPVLPTPQGWLILIVMGISGVGGQMLMTFGYRYIRAAEGGVIMLSQIVYSTVVGIVWFSEPLHITTIAGAVLILGAAVWLAVSADPPRTAI